MAKEAVIKLGADVQGAKKGVKELKGELDKLNEGGKKQTPQNSTDSAKKEVAKKSKKNEELVNKENFIPYKYKTDPLKGNGVLGGEKGGEKAEGGSIAAMAGGAMKFAGLAGLALSVGSCIKELDLFKRVTAGAKETLDAVLNPGQRAAVAGGKADALDDRARRNGVNAFDQFGSEQAAANVWGVDGAALLDKFGAAVSAANSGDEGKARALITGLGFSKQEVIDMKAMNSEQRAVTVMEKAASADPRRKDQVIFAMSQLIGEDEVGKVKGNLGLINDYKAQKEMLSSYMKGVVGGEEQWNKNLASQAEIEVVNSKKEAQTYFSTDGSNDSAQRNAQSELIGEVRANQGMVTRDNLNQAVDKMINGVLGGFLNLNQGLQQMLKEQTGTPQSTYSE